MAAALDEVGRRIERLRTDREQGATALAREALAILALAAEVAPRGETPLVYLRQVAGELARARPAMAAIKNVVLAFVKGLEQQGSGRDTAPALSHDLLARMEEASSRTARNAASLLPPAGAVLTCSYSSTVVRACLAAMGQGKPFTVLAAESRWRGIPHGEKVASELRAVGLAAPIQALAENPSAPRSTQASGGGANLAHQGWTLPSRLRCP